MNTPQRPNSALNTPGQGNTPTAPRAARMTLSAVTRGVMAQPVRVVIYGGGGIGKSTFGSEAPSPIFLGPEDGSALLNVARFPQPENWTDVRDAIATLRTDTHEFQTLVIDSLDWLEPLCWAHVCAQGRKQSIEDFGYGKGYIAALESWRAFIADLEALRKVKRMHIVCIAHSVVAPFKNPAGEDYDRFAMKLHKSASGLFAEWCDELIFVARKTHAVKVDPKGSRGRGYGGEERVMYTDGAAAFDAKSRHGLPREMPLSWAEFFAATQRNTGELAKSIRADIGRALERLSALDAAAGETARKAADATGDDPNALNVILNKINAGIAARERSATDTNG